MSGEEIISFWGTDNLKRWSASSLERVNIPGTSKDYLQSVGLPCGVDWTVRFDSDADDLPELPDRASYRRIGFDVMVPLCLDESHKGSVVCVETSVGGSERLVNSTVEAFGGCLTLYQKYRQSVVDLPEDEIDELIDGIEEGMREIDGVAFGDANNYWPVIIEQMRAGLL